MKYLSLALLAALSGCANPITTGPEWDRKYTEMAYKGAYAGNSPPYNPAPDWQSPFSAFQTLP